VAAGGLRLGVVALDGDDVCWLEGRPREGGRNALMRRTPDGRIAEVTPPQSVCDELTRRGMKVIGQLGMVTSQSTGEPQRTPWRGSKQR
jgi:hypothetical protein